MDLVLFNFNDLSLILIIAQSLMLTVLFFQSSNPSQYKNLFLSAFLLTVAIETFDVLIYWCQPLKVHFFPENTHLFFVFKFMPLLQGPLLYWYTKSVIHSDFTITRKSLFHLLPTALFPLYLFVIYGSLGMDNVHKSVNSYDILFNNVFYQILLWGQKLSLLSYGCICYWLLRHHNAELEKNYSNIEDINSAWLRLLVGGFFVLWAWEFISQLSSLLFTNAMLSDKLGVLGNYFKFMLINALAFLSLSYASNTKQQPAPNIAEKTAPPEPFSTAQAETIVAAMEQKQLYLNPELTLDQLAESADIPARLVSTIINRSFNKNFFEFTNYYRIEHAKKLLSDEHSRLSILDIMADAGFNSKSAFNRFFKKNTDMTPTQYRRSHAKKNTEAPKN